MSQGDLDEEMEFAMEKRWKTPSRVKVAVAVTAAGIFWFHALTDRDGFLILDYVNLPFHEFGHVLFGIFGRVIGIWGGTISQLAIPFVICATFFARRDASGSAFSAFWFGENLLNVSVYISDARSMTLPLVGSGEHDWNTILSGLRMLHHDTSIAGVVKAVGWLIMVSSVVWYVLLWVMSDRRHPGREKERIIP